MIAKREEARRKREAEQDEEENKESHPLDAIMDQVELERKRRAHPSLQWKGKIAPEQQSGNIYSKRQKRVQAQGKTIVPTLFQICVNFLVKNFEHVEALGDVESSIRRDVANELVAKKKLNGAAFDVLTEVGIEALELIDCAEVTQEQLGEALKKLLPAGLRFLLLHHAGRCFGPMAVKEIISTPGSQLFGISIAGAYLLHDADASSLVNATSKHLSSIDFRMCHNLGPEFCKALNTSYSSAGAGTLVELSLHELRLSKEDLLSIGASDAARNLKSLTLSCLDNLDDEALTTILDKVGDGLEGIDLSWSFHISDESLSAIRSCNVSGTLRSLQLSGLKKLTEIGLEALFTPAIPGLPSPPMLRKVDLSSLQYQAVTDTVMELVCQSSSMKRDSEGGVSEHLSSMGGLVYVNIAGSSCTDNTMERLAATSASSIKELNVSSSPKVTDKGLGYLVSKAGNQLGKIHIWGDAQISEEFLDGHGRVSDPGLQIVGAWMKKGNTSSRR